MPFYNYRCAKGHAIVARRGYEARTIPCACGATMKRAEFNCPELIGETVPKYGARPGAAGIKDKHGRWRLDLFQEAHAEIAHDAERHGLPAPNLYQKGIDRARQMGAPIR